MSETYYVTHPVFEKEYDCPRFEFLFGEMRWHLKGEKSNCRSCEIFRDSQGPEYAS